MSTRPRVVLLAEPDSFAQELATKLEPHALLSVVPSVEATLSAVVQSPTPLVLIGAGDSTFVHSNKLMRVLGNQPRPLVILLRHTWEPALVEAQQGLTLRADGYLATGFGVDALVEQLVRCLHSQSSLGRR